MAFIATDTGFSAEEQSLKKEHGTVVAVSNQGSWTYTLTQTESTSISPLQQEAIDRAQKIMTIISGPNRDGRDPECLQYLFTYPVFPIQHFAQETIKMLDQIKPELVWLVQNGRDILNGMPQSEERYKKYILEPKTGNPYFIGLDNLYVDMAKKLKGEISGYDQEALIGSCIYISTHMGFLCDILKR